MGSTGQATTILNEFMLHAINKAKVVGTALMAVLIMVRIGTSPVPT